VSRDEIPSKMLGRQGLIHEPPCGPTRLHHRDLANHMVPWSPQSPPRSESTRVAFGETVLAREGKSGKRVSLLQFGARGFVERASVPLTLGSIRVADHRVGRLRPASDTPSPLGPLTMTRTPARAAAPFTMWACQGLIRRRRTAGGDSGIVVRRFGPRRSRGTLDVATGSRGRFSATTRRREASLETKGPLSDLAVRSEATEHGFDAANEALERG
jgi:hypothetical protein